MTTTTTTRSRSTRRAPGNQAALANAAAVAAAAADEQCRFNEALAAGAEVWLATFSGRYRVARVTSQWEYYTPAANGGFGLAWAGANDGTWADLLAQAGVARHPRWAHFTV